MVQTLKNIPIGVQDFESLIHDDYLYVDKTELIYRLITTGRYYFLSRPRRFGKSLLISTLKAFFLGKKELFHGLAIENFAKEWVEYPVLHLDLNTEKYDTKEALENKHFRCGKVCMAKTRKSGRWQRVSMALSVELAKRRVGEWLFWLMNTTNRCYKPLEIRNFKTNIVLR